MLGEKQSHSGRRSLALHAPGPLGVICFYLEYSVGRSSRGLEGFCRERASGSWLGCPHKRPASEVTKLLDEPARLYRCTGSRSVCVRSERLTGVMIGKEWGWKVSQAVRKPYPRRAALKGCCLYRRRHLRPRCRFHLRLCRYRMEYRLPRMRRCLFLDVEKAF